MMGSVLWLLCYEVLPNAPDANMVCVWKALVEQYASGKVKNQYTNLGLSSFCNPDQPKYFYPKLKGRGGEVKALVWPLYMVWLKMHKPTPQHKRVASVLKHQVELQQIIDDHASETFLPSDDAHKFTSIAHTMLKEYSVLASMAGNDKNKCCFLLLPSATGFGI